MNTQIIFNVGGRLTRGRILVATALATGVLITAAGAQTIQVVGGNVGIGTPAPAVALQVQSSTAQTGRTFRLAFDSTYYGELAQLGSNGLNLNSVGGALSFSTSGAEAMRIISTGAVGLGMTNPTNFGRLTIQQIGTGFGSHGLIVTSGQTNGGVALSDSGASAYKMLQSYGGALAINPQGNNVGIGTTNPVYRFDVQGATPGAGHSRFLNTNGGIYFDVEGTVPGSNTSAILRLRNAGATTAMLFSNGGANDFNIATGSNGATTAMRVDAVGNVGIGTTTPRAKLDFGQVNNPQVILLGESGTVRTGFGLEPSNANMRVFSPDAILLGTVSLGDGSTWSEKMRVNSAGNVGIGTTNPGQKLDIAGNFQVNVGNPQIPFISVINTFNNVLSNAGWDYKQLEFKQQDGVVVWDIGWHSGGLGFKVNNGASQPLFLAQGGNVGIGTNAPSALLHISKTGVTTSADMLKIAGGYDGSNLGGALTIKAIYHSGYGADYDFAVGQWNGAGFSNLSLLNLNANGNVGIGTSSPTHKLTVAGPVRATQFIGDVNTWSDSVFKPGYRLASLSEVESAIHENGHLPEIPSEAEVKRDGVDMAQMQAKLLQKIEELTLHMIEQEKRLGRQEARLRSIEQENTALKAGTTLR